MTKTILLLPLALLLAACAQPPAPSIVYSDYIDHWRLVEANPRNSAVSPVATEDTEDTEDTKDTEDASSGNLWDRIRSSLSLTDIDHPRIEQHVAELKRKPRYFGTLSERARPYLRYLIEEANARGVPAEILMVPMIESGFRPDAGSPGNAAGLWQLMPDTARRLGLKRNAWYDGRYDVLASTEAALDYLSYLNEKFDGDWLLTLAAYNSGEGTVMKAIRRNREAGRDTDYWSLQLPAITREYVPKILAVSRVLAEPEHYGISLRNIQDKPYLEKIEIGPKTDLAIAAAAAGIDQEEINEYNPGIKFEAGAKTASNQSIELLLPPALAQSLQETLRTMGDTRLSAGQRRRFEQHYHTSGAKPG